MLRVLAIAGGIAMAFATPAVAAWSATASGPARPQSTTISPAGTLSASCGAVSATVKLDWGASTTPWIEGYEVRWGTLPGAYTTSAATTSTSYTTGPLPIGTYYFAVRANRGQWRSADSNEVSKVVVSVVGLSVCQ